MTIILKQGWQVPVPKGYTLERCLSILREIGHTPVSIRDSDGKVRPVEEVEQAA